MMRRFGFIFLSLIILAVFFGGFPISFGDTHDPEQKKSAGRRYYNTVTWIPVYEPDAANIRLDRTHTFLQFSKDKNGDIKTGGLMRWNDDAGRIDALELHDSI